MSPSVRHALAAALFACAAGCAAGCALSHELPAPSPRDAAAPVDAGADVPVVPDAGPPTTGCFAGPLTLATFTAMPGGRVHLEPLGIAARPGGWLAEYRENISSRQSLAFLDLDGHELGTSPLENFGVTPIRTFFVVGDTLIVVRGEGVERIDLGATAVLHEHAPRWLGGGEGDPWDVVQAATLLPSGVIRVLSAHGDGTTRISDFTIDDTPTYGLSVRESVLAGAPHYFAGTGAFFSVSGDTFLYVGPLDATTYPPVWHVLHARIDTTALGTTATIPWTVLDDAAWPDDPPRAAGSDAPGVAGVTTDGRLVTAREYPSVAYLETPPTPTVPTPARTRLGDGYPWAQTERTGTDIGILFGDRFETFSSLDLTPRQTLALDSWSHTYLARQGDLVAILYERVQRPEDDPTMKSFGIACIALE